MSGHKKITVKVKFTIFGRCRNRITKESKEKSYHGKFDLLYHLALDTQIQKAKLFKRITPIYSFCDLQKGIIYENWLNIFLVLNKR